ncbi:hypothetical protein J4444_03445 [Candidatus Woesearchaeota archaeon]|nr:hypothetical protein [Candidatus Woesearchaeota archaeon]
MNFDECIARKLLSNTGEIDRDKARELLLLAEHKEAFWEKVQKESAQFPTLFLEGHYEIIKELVVAILSLEGWRSENHDCLFQYLLEKKKDLDLDREYLSELRKLRNRIDYNGTKISADLWITNELHLKLLIKALKSYLKQKLSEK